MRRGRYVNAVCMSTRYAKTKANKTINNFVQLSLSYIHMKSNWFISNTSSEYQLLSNT